MGFEIYNNSTQYAEFIVMIIFTPLGVAVTALRFVATRRGARKLGFDDWMAGTATLFFVLFNIAALMGKLKLFLLPQVHHSSTGSLESIPLEFAADIDLIGCK